MQKIETNLGSPPRKKSNKRLKGMIQKENSRNKLKDNLKLSGLQSSSINKIKVSEREIIHTLNNNQEKIKEIKKSIKNKNKKKEKSKTIRSKKKYLSSKTTQGFNQDISKSIKL